MLRNVLGVLCNVLSVLRNDLGVLQNVLSVLCNVLGVLCNVLPWTVHGVNGPWAAQEGPIELLLAKVKNASGRIGIFVLCISTLVSKAQI